MPHDAPEGLPRSGFGDAPVGPSADRTTSPRPALGPSNPVARVAAPATPNRRTPDQRTPDGGALNQGTPDQGASNQGTPNQGTPNQGTPPEDTRTQHAPSGPNATPQTQAAPIAAAENASDEPHASFGDLDLNLLVVFDAVMQDRSLTRAARRLDLSQPAASHALARLRNVLHDPLFVRAPDGMRPTPRAEQIAGQVREALRLLRTTLEPESFDPARSQRRFTLIVNNYAARTIVPGLSRRLAEQAPGILLDVHPMGRLEVLDSPDADGVDLALTVLGDGGERFKSLGVAEDDYVAVIDRNHPVAQMRVLTAERLAAMPHIELTSTGYDTSFVDRALAERGLTRRIAVRVPFLSSTLLLVNSDYVTVLPRRVATDLAAICPLAVKDLPFASPWLVLSMIWHRRLDTHPAQRWLRDAVREIGQTAPGAVA